MDTDHDLEVIHAAHAARHANRSSLSVGGVGGVMMPPQVDPLPGSISTGTGSMACTSSDQFGGVAGASGSGAGGAAGGAAS